MSTTVYIVQGCDYEDQDVRAVYLDEKLAIEDVKQRGDSYITYNEYEILTELDKDIDS